jgi:hypothetical protein
MGRKSLLSGFNITKHGSSAVDPKESEIAAIKGRAVTTFKMLNFLLVEWSYIKVFRIIQEMNDFLQIHNNDKYFKYSKYD